MFILRDLAIYYSDLYSTIVTWFIVLAPFLVLYAAIRRRETSTILAMIFIMAFVITQLSVHSDFSPPPAEYTERWSY